MGYHYILCRHQENNRDYQQTKNNPFTHRFDNLDVLDQFLRKPELPYITQYEIDTIFIDI